MFPLTEQLADRLTGGQLTGARAAVLAAQDQLMKFGEQYQTLYSETRKLTCEVETLKEGRTSLSEGYADASWNNRLALDRQWQMISGYQQHREILKSDVDLYHDLVSYAYQFSPLIKGAIDIKTRYTFGLSFSIESEMEKNKELIKAVMDDPKNRSAFLGAQAIAEADRELQKGGNIYIAIWMKTDPIQVRVWTSYEIGDVLMDPNDANIAMFYIRSWIDPVKGQQTKAYPSLFNDKYAGIVNQNGIIAEVDNEVLVYQMSEGRGLKQKWALSPFTSALPWNRAYERFLLDFVTIVEMIRKYSTMFTTAGGQAQVTALSDQFRHEQHGRHAGQAGNGLIVTEGNDFKVIDAGSGKIVGLQDARQILMQFTTSTGVPENMLTGNPQTGNRASAQELTANFLPIIEERQTAWAETFTAIFSRILGNSEFTVSFPPIRSQDALTYLQGLTQAATLGQAGRLAGTIRPEDVIRAAYEALDLKVPDDITIDEMVAGIMDLVNADPDMAAAVNRLAAAAKQMGESPQVRETDEGQWVTIGGARILIKDGETAGDAFKRTTGKELSGGGGSEATPGKSGDTGGTFRSYDKAGLNKDQIEAINEYKSASKFTYEEINSYVRDGKVGSGDNSKLEDTIKNLDSSFTEIVPQGKELFGGKKAEIYTGVGKTQATQLINSKVGDTFEDRDYQSFSTDKDMAKSFSKGIGKSRAGIGVDHVILRMEGDGKTKCINIGGTEKEVLLPRGKAFEVIGRDTEKSGGLAVYHVITVRMAAREHIA